MDRTQSKAGIFFYELKRLVEAQTSDISIRHRRIVGEVYVPSSRVGLVKRQRLVGLIRNEKLPLYRFSMCDTDLP
jgi:hypothetical protein